MHEFIAQPDTLNKAILDLENSENWETRYKKLLQLAKQFPSLGEAYCDTPHEIMGCQSKTWLAHTLVDGKHYFAIASKAKIIKSLTLVLLHHINGKDGASIAALDCSAIFETYQLSKHISTSRSNGILAIIQRIKTLAKED